jgi:nucleoside-diphosphate-sugar epimerase
MGRSLHDEHRHAECSMKILVTGAGGFLGQRIAQSLLAEGASDLRLHFRTKSPAGWIDQLRQQFPEAKIEESRADLLRRGTLDDLVRNVDCLVHAAAAMRGTAEEMLTGTVDGTRNLLELATAASVRRVVLISSFAVYRTADLPRNGVHDESVPVEVNAVNKGPYAQAKTQQEKLLESFQDRFRFESVVIRPGVVYGPGGSAFSSRVGIVTKGLFLNLGGPATLPLTYVENCADAIALAALKAPAGSTYNVVDDDLPSCTEYLHAYQQQVREIRSVRIPYWAFLLGSRLLQSYHKRLKRHRPPAFTPAIVQSMYRPLRYDNGVLKSLGWKQRIATREGLRRTFEYWRDHAP